MDISQLLIRPDHKTIITKVEANANIPCIIMNGGILHMPEQNLQFTATNGNLSVSIMGDDSGANQVVDAYDFHNTIDY